MEPFALKKPSSWTFQHPNPTQFLCDPTTYLPFETLVLTPQQAQKLRHGQKLLEQELANQPLKRKQHYVLQSGTEHPELVGIGWPRQCAP
ncbi:MAG: hypothetical protein R2857_11305 [Vampirovibrionales bacterium]